MARRRSPVCVVLVVTLVLSSTKTLVQSSVVNPIYAFPPSTSPSSSSVPHSSPQKHHQKDGSLTAVPKTASPPLHAPSMEGLPKESVRQESQVTLDILPPLKLAGHQNNIPESATGQSQKTKGQNSPNPQHLTSAVPSRGNSPLQPPNFPPPLSTASSTPFIPFPDNSKPLGPKPKVNVGSQTNAVSVPPFFHNANSPLVPVQNPLTNVTNNDARSFFPSSVDLNNNNAVIDFVNYVPLDYENGQTPEMFLPQKREAPRRRSGRGRPLPRPRHHNHRPLPRFPRFQRRSSNATSASPFKNIINSFHSKVSRILMGPRRRSSRPLRKKDNDMRFMQEEPRRSFTEQVETTQDAQSMEKNGFKGALNKVSKLLQTQYIPVLGKRERVRTLSKDESARIDQDIKRYRKLRRNKPPRRSRHPPRRRRPHHAPPHHHPHQYHRERPYHHPRGQHQFEEEENPRYHEPGFKVHKEHHHHQGLLENPEEEIIIKHKPIDRPKKYLGFRDQPHFNDDFHIPAYKESGPPYKAFNNFRGAFKNFKPWRPNFKEFHELRGEHEPGFAPEVIYEDGDGHERYKKKPPAWSFDSDERGSHYPSHHFKGSHYSKRPHHHEKYKEYSGESMSYYDPNGLHDGPFKPIKPYYKSRGKFHHPHHDWEESPRKKPRKFHKMFEYDHGLVGVSHFNQVDAKLTPGASIPAIIKESDPDAKVPKIIINHHHNLPPATAGSNFVPGFASSLLSYSPSTGMRFHEDYFAGAANLPGGSNAGMKRDYKSASEYPEAFPMPHEYGKPPPNPHYFGAPPPPQGFGMTAAAPPGAPFGAAPPLSGPMGPYPPHGPGSGPPQMYPMNNPMGYQNFGPGMGGGPWVNGKPHVDQSQFIPSAGPMEHHHHPSMPDHFPKPMEGYTFSPHGPQNPHHHHQHHSGEGGFGNHGNFGKPSLNHNEINDPFSHNNNDNDNHHQNDQSSPFNQDQGEGSPFGDDSDGPGPSKPPSPFSSQETPHFNPSSPPFSQENHHHHQSSDGPFFGNRNRRPQRKRKPGRFSSEHLPPPDASPFPSTNDPQDDDSYDYLPPFSPVPNKNDINPTQGPSSPSSRESFFRFNNPSSREHSHERPPHARGFDLTVTKTITAGFDLPPNPLSPLNKQQQHRNRRPPPPPEPTKSNLFSLEVPNRDHYKNKQRQRQRQRTRENSSSSSSTSNRFQNNYEHSREDHPHPPSRRDPPPPSDFSSPSSSNKLESNENNYSTLPENWQEFRPDPSHKKLPSLTYDSLEIGSRMYKIKSALSPKGIMKAIMNRFPRARFFEKGKGNRAHTKFTPYDAVSKSEEDKVMMSPSSRKRRKSIKNPSSIQDIINGDSNSISEIIVALPEEDAASFNGNIVLDPSTFESMSGAASGGNNKDGSSGPTPSSSTPTTITLSKLEDPTKDILPRRKLKFNFQKRSGQLEDSTTTPPHSKVEQAKVKSLVNHNTSNHQQSQNQEEYLYDDVLVGMQSIQVPVKANIQMGEVFDGKRKKKK